MLESNHFVLGYDPTGRAPENRKTEVIALQSSHDADGNRIGIPLVPKHAPFFANELAVYKGRVLTEEFKLTLGTDYQLTHPYTVASDWLNKQLNSGIFITLKDGHWNNTEFSVVYQALGGPYQVSEHDLLKFAIEYNLTPPLISFEQLLGRPVVFHPTEHLTDGSDVIGMNEVVEGLNKVKEAMDSRAPTPQQKIENDFITEMGVGVTLLNNLGVHKQAICNSILAPEKGVRITVPSQDSPTGAKCYFTLFNGVQSLDFEVDVLTFKLNGSYETWASGKTYQSGTVVKHQGTVYYAVAVSADNTQSPDTSTDWVARGVNIGPTDVTSDGVSIRVHFISSGVLVMDIIPPATLVNSRLVMTKLLVNSLASETFNKGWIAYNLPA